MTGLIGRSEGPLTNNLIAEMVKIGVPARSVAKEVAKTLGVTEKTARNKMNCKTGFTVPEAVKINDVWFNGEQKLEYLFQDVPTVEGQTA